MSAQDNLATARRLIEEVWNEGRFELIDEIVAEDFVNHDPADPEDVRGRDAYRERIEMYHQAMPDMKVAIDDAFAADEFVAMRWHVEGTNDGEMQGMPATHKQVAVTGQSISRFDDDGKITEDWDQWDNLSFMQQLGLIGQEAGSASR